VKRGIGLQEGLLHQVFGVGRVARHAQRRSVELVDERQRIPLKPDALLLRALAAHHAHDSCPRRSRRGYAVWLRAISVCPTDEPLASDGLPGRVRLHVGVHRPGRTEEQLAHAQTVPRHALF
jgi:hypothetical protein